MRKKQNYYAYIYIYIERERERESTCTGPAATNRPASPPPTTRPSGPAKETLIPPDLLFVPPLSVGI